MTSNWTDLLNRGLQGERLVREWLKLRGFYVLPASLIQNGGAPALEGHLKRVIASDYLVAGGGETFWAEVKTYQRATFNQHRQRWEHGVPIRLWNQYKEGQRITGIPGYLFILQLDQKLILEGQLADIAIGSVKMPRHPTKTGPQIFFDVRQFTWYSLDTFLQLSAMLPSNVTPKTIRPWEKGKKFPKEQQKPLL